MDALSGPLFTPLVSFFSFSSAALKTNNIIIFNYANNLRYQNRTIHLTVLYSKAAMTIITVITIRLLTPPTHTHTLPAR